MTAAFGAVLIVALAGCTPEPPEPTPTSTSAFASEAEAFAAAEETYRAYVDALNEVDLSDPETFEPVYDLTTGELNASDRKSFSQWHSDEYSKVGDATILSIDMDSVDLASKSQVVAHACLDISTVDIVDAAGRSIVAPDRPPVQSLIVTFQEQAGSSTDMRIASLDPAGEASQC